MSSRRSSTRRSFICRSISPRSCLRISSGSLVRKRTRLPGVRRIVAGGFIALPVYATPKPPLHHPDEDYQVIRTYRAAREDGFESDDHWIHQLSEMGGSMSPE